MLEDNQVSLATMKASRYVKAFEEDVSGLGYQAIICKHIKNVILTTKYKPLVCFSLLKSNNPKSISRWINSNTFLSRWINGSVRCPVS